ncbi:MAG: hypothetical protein ABIW49_00365 [Knoellia sp.]
MSLLDDYLELKIRIGQILLVAMGVVIGAGFTLGAVETGQWAWLIAIPMDLAGIALVVLGGLTRRRTENARGTAQSIVGALLIVGSIWAAFLLGNAFPV